jgi:hypothetical protein
MKLHRALVDWCAKLIAMFGLRTWESPLNFFLFFGRIIWELALS